MSLPRNLTYRGIKPRGFASMYKKEFVYPTSSYNSFKSGEIIRSQYTTTGYIDPYASYFEIQVTIDPTVIVGGTLELDGPSTSLISELVITSDSREVERIQEYDQLGQILEDLGMPHFLREQKDYEGYATNHHISNPYEQMNVKPFIGPSSVAGTQFDFGLGGQFSDQLVPWGPQYGSIPDTQVNPTVPYAEAVATILPRTGLMSGMNPSYAPTVTNTNNYRVPYDAMAIYDGEGGIQSTGANNLFFSNASTNSALSGSLSAVSTSGYFLPYSSQLSSNTKHQTLTTWPSTWIQNGGFLTQPAQVLTKTFIVPILSGVMGVLIPQSEYKLIPGKALKQLNFETYMNPNAFFTSGFTPNFIINNAQMIPRTWMISSFIMYFDVYYFDKEIDNQITQMLMSEQGLVLSSTSYSLGPQYAVGSNNAVSNNWQINNGIESLKTLMCWFIDNNYLTFPYCRKNYRLSMNITQFQIKIGPEFFPQYPISGNAGNPYNVVGDNTGDNTDFIVELHKAAGSLFDTTRLCKINRLNFAPTVRPYIPKLAGQFVLADQVDFAQSLWQERRCVGKALYMFNLEEAHMDQDFMSGKDIRRIRPIDLMLKGNALPATVNATMYIMLKHDFVVQFTINGVRTFGSG